MQRSSGIGRSYATAQAAKNALFAAGNGVVSRKNRQETIFSDESRVRESAPV
jgi:hypothetical protein